MNPNSYNLTIRLDIAVLILLLAAIAVGVSSYFSGLDRGLTRATDGICTSVGGVPVGNVCVQPGALMLPPADRSV